MDVLTAQATAEIEVKRSRFIAEALPVLTQDEARSLLKNQKLRYADARHVVHAFVLGAAGEIRGMSDDGEPSGTAGRPVMDCLTGKQCTNILLTVTRYFGGILLGTGGLSRAYGDAAKAVLAVCATKPFVALCPFEFSAGYAEYEHAARFLSELYTENIEATFGTNVRVTGSIAEVDYERLVAYLREKCLMCLRN